MTVQAIYLFLDGTRTLLMNRILPSNEILVNFTSLCLAITLNILSYTTVMFVAYKIRMRWLAGQAKSSFVYIVTRIQSITKPAQAVA